MKLPQGNWNHMDDVLAMDLANTPYAWVILTPNEAEYNAAVKWALECGMEWYAPPLPYSPLIKGITSGNRGGFGRPGNALLVKRSGVLAPDEVLIKLQFDLMVTSATIEEQVIVVRGKKYKKHEYDEMLSKLTPIRDQ